MTVKEAVAETLKGGLLTTEQIVQLVSESTGAKYDSVARQLRAMRQRGEIGWDGIHYRSPGYSPEDNIEQDKPVLSDAEVDEYIELTVKRQPIEQKLGGIKRDISVPIHESGWFGIVFGSDWHIGSVYTQLLTIRHEAQIIHDTPHLYYVFLGDAMDGGIPAAPHGGILNEQNMTPEMQRQVSERIARLIGVKMLMAASGCHAWWAIDAADYDFIKRAFTEATNCQYLGDGTKFYLQCDGGAEYCGVMHHKPSGHSQYNDLHPCVRVALYSEQEAEVIAIAHEHIIAVGKQMIGGKMRYMARTSSRKSFDRYGSKCGADSKRYDGMDVPVLLLHGEYKTGQWITGIETAADLVTALNAA